MPLAPRPLTPTDLPAALALNNAAAPHVNVLDADGLARLWAWAAVALGARGDDGGLLGFLLALPPDLPYDSANYRWVVGRRPQFLYVDRVVVTPGARGRGVGRALYRAALDAARCEGYASVVCEVNERPPNPGSLAFHAALGFGVIGRCDHGPHDKAVVFLERAGAA
ncbi:GNAT family N-acetyltransferase [Roseospira goensis]|uniref:N-acetyltransferase domain-containing protein n=1 Tax=Roseospira goensis TaxID=391922 RepID=A0A7W6WJG0_9PROT|nr:GNAT family N-acetyltransferase [Roseospira goensis]MBB4285166.1 hypothetical protein [Roseospira goensis]